MVITLCLSGLIPTPARGEPVGYGWLVGELSLVSAYLGGEEVELGAADDAVAQLALEGGFYPALWAFQRRLGEQKGELPGDRILHGFGWPSGVRVTGAYMRLSRPELAPYSLWLVNLEPLGIFPLPAGRLVARVLTTEGEWVASEQLTESHPLWPVLGGMAAGFKLPGRLAGYRTTTVKVILPAPGIDAGRVVLMELEGAGFRARLYNFAELRAIGRAEIGEGPVQKAP